MFDFIEGFLILFLICVLPWLLMGDAVNNVTGVKKK